MLFDLINLTFQIICFTPLRLIPSLLLLPPRIAREVFSYFLFPIAPPILKSMQQPFQLVQLLLLPGPPLLFPILALLNNQSS